MCDALVVLSSELFEVLSCSGPADKDFGSKERKLTQSWIM